VVSTERLPAASTTRRITSPFTAHGVAMSFFRTCARGIRASIWLSVSCVRATRPISRTKAAAPSKTLLNSGTMNPPRPSPPKIVDSSRPTLVRSSGEVVVHST